MIPDICIRCARSLASAVLLTLVVSLSAAGVRAQTATFARTDYPFLGNNHAVGDFNGDGKLDLAGTGGNSARVMLGNGDGTFRPQVQYPAGGPTQDLAAGDFNGDGKLDLAVTINDPQIGLSLLTGNGDGTFGAPANFPNTTQLDSPAVVATDLDNDGSLDVVVAHYIGCYTAPCTVGWTISLMFGNGDGTFQGSREIVVGTGMSEIAVGDFNRDGIKDLGIAGDSSRVYVLLGLGNGTFVQQPTITLTADTFGVDATDIDMSDFNGDSVQDLVVAIGLNGSRTAILLGEGDGTFREPRIIAEPNQRIPLYQSVADFNGDGRQDLAVGLGWGTEGLMEILSGNGDGTFQQPRLYLVPASKTSVSGGSLAAADFNNDGRPDIALQVTGANPALAALRNSTGAAPTPTPTPVPLAYGSVTVAPSSVVAGQTAQVSVTLASGGVAPSDGLRLTVSSSNTSVATVPSTATIPAGGSSVQFNVSTRSVTSTRTVNITVSNSRLGSRSVSLTVTPATPSAPTLSAVTLTPSSVTGGSTSQGRVTLSATAQAATTVNLASNSGRASVPASVTVPAGASSATFNVSTTAVTSNTSATISATLNGSTRNATLTITPPTSTTDRVSITRAEYERSKRTLRVEATSTRSTATLQVFNTSSGQLIGTLRNNGGGRYSGQFSLSANPQNITVRSSLGGSATRSVSNR